MPRSPPVPSFATGVVRTGGGYKACGTASSSLQDEIEGLYRLINKQRTEVERLEGALSASAREKMADRAQMQELADQLAAAQAERTSLATDCLTAHAALADRGLGLDALEERGAVAESRAAAAEHDKREAAEAAAGAVAGEAAAKEKLDQREAQIERLLAGMRGQKAEADDLRSQLALAKQAVADVDALHRRAVEELTHRGGEAERELRAMLHEQAQRAVDERAELRAQMHEEHVAALAREATAREAHEARERSGEEAREKLEGEAMAARSEVERMRSEVQSMWHEASLELEASRADASERRREAEHSAREAAAALLLNGSYWMKN